MFAKIREKPPTLVVMEALRYYMPLTGKALRYLDWLQKGYIGELSFDQWLEVLGELAIVFPDLLLQPKYGNAFQLDAVVLVDRVFYLYEVKNYFGEYRYGKEMWLNELGTNIVNPAMRLAEKKNMFIKMLHDLGYKNEFQVEAYTVLVNPNCTMFHAPKDPNLLLPTQLHGHFEKIKNSLSPLTKLHRQVMEDLLANQGGSKVFWENVPQYDLDNLHKGVSCPQCKSKDLDHARETSTCNQCRYQTKTVQLIESSIKHFQVLFPDQPIDSTVIYQWCDSTFRKKRIHKVLIKMGLA